MSLNDKCITTTTITKFLGIWVQDNLKWSTHIANLSSKLNKCSYAIRVLSGCTSLMVCRAAYFGYFHSVMQYGIIFWGNSPDSIVLFRIQKRTIRAMVRLGRLESCRPVFKNLNIMPLPCVYIYRLLLFVRTDMSNSGTFLINQQIHNHYTRQKNDLHVNFANTSLWRSGVQHSGVSLYNNLPDSIKNIVSPKLFKKELKSYLLKHSFYSVLDYLNSCNK